MLFDDAFRADPHPTYAGLRADAPVHRVVAPGDIPIWLVTRWDEARQVLTDPSLSKERSEVRLPPHLHAALGNQMLLKDPPDHTHLRRLVSAAFTARRTEALRPRVQEITDGLLAALPAAGTVDLIDTFAFPLPIQVICELLGIPAEDRDSFRAWSDVVVSGPPGNPAMPTAMQELVTYIGALLQRKRREQRDDLLSALLAVVDSGDRLSDDELTAMVFLLLVAGHETTVNLIGNAVLLIGRRPELRDRLAADPGLLPSAVEEFLRYESPVATTTYRRTTRPITVGGVTVPAGEQILVSLLSANRDERHFPAPQDLDPARRDNQHLAFGHGIHYCLGAPLARLEAQIALGSLLARYPKLEVDVPGDRLDWRTGILIRGLTALPVRLA